ncbi:MAG: lipid-A-disaccharide synthase [Proteobacteria bacterium]|nr:lipid-A-disaccharide synthase [Pseudomonadota bacterium]
MLQSPLIFLIAGEASGDKLGADLMVSLKDLRNVRFAGIGGEAMEAHGLKSLFPMEELSLMGIVSILKNLPNLCRRLRFTVETIRTLKPDVVVTIDSPEFSFRVMKRLHQLTQRPRLIHYVAPTVWAWRPGRAKKIAGFLDHLLCIYPFEPLYFEKYGLKTTFVGHPVAKEAPHKPKRNPNLLCVLPGSRRSEVESLLPTFKETVDLLKNNLPDLEVIIPTIPAVEELVRKGVQTWSNLPKIVIGDMARQETFQNSFVALAASGTVALQLSAAGLPFVIAYKVNKINEWMIKLFVKTPWACMVNILLAFQKCGFLKKDMSQYISTPWIPEFIQQNCTSEKLAPALLALFKDKKTRQLEISAMNEAIVLLKAPDYEAARVVLEELSLSMCSFR